MIKSTMFEYDMSNAFNLIVKKHCNYVPSDWFLFGIPFIMFRTMEKITILSSRGVVKHKL